VLIISELCVFRILENLRRVSENLGKSQEGIVIEKAA
jgi:hypothetical protein